LPAALGTKLRRRRTFVLAGKTLESGHPISRRQFLKGRSAINKVEKTEEEVKAFTV